MSITQGKGVVFVLRGSGKGFGVDWKNLTMKLIYEKSNGKQQALCNFKAFHGVFEQVICIDESP